MKFNFRLQKVQTKFNIEYSGIKELKNAEQGLQFYTEDIVKKIRKYIKIDTNDKVLDFGAGSGQLAELWRDKYEINPICLEIDPRLVDVLVAKKFRVFQKLDEIQDEIKFVYASNVLEHIEDDVAALKEIKNKMAVNGKLVIYVPALPILFSDFDASVGHYRRYTKKALINKVTSAGFKVEDCFWNDSLGVLASLAVKLLGYEGKLKLGNVTFLLVYDRVIYPISKILDLILFKYLIGKNLFLIAKKTGI
jgi:SAM-dependent methyltransferase